MDAKARQEKERLPDSGRPNTGIDVRGSDIGIEEGPGAEIGGRRNANATMDVRSCDTQ